MCVLNGLREHGPSPFFRRLEDRIERKLQQNFGELQATSSATLHEVQLTREALTKQSAEDALSTAAGVGSSTWAHRPQARSYCRSAEGKNVHVPAGPGDAPGNIHPYIHNASDEPALRLPPSGGGPAIISSAISGKENSLHFRSYRTCADWKLSAAVLKAPLPSPYSMSYTRQNRQDPPGSCQKPAGRRQEIMSCIMQA